MFQLATSLCLSALGTHTLSPKSRARQRTPDEGAGGAFTVAREPGVACRDQGGSDGYRFSCCFG